MGVPFSIAMNSIQHSWNARDKVSCTSNLPARHGILFLWNTDNLAAPASRSPSCASAPEPLAGKDEFFKAWGAVEWPKPARSSTSAWRPASTSSTPPTSTPSARSEEVLGAAIKHLRREDVLISTKATFRFGDGPNDVGSSRYHLIQALEGSLKRLGTDYIDVYHMHDIDSLTPVEETLSTLDKFVRDGKVRYIACSNFSGWRLMKSLSVSERYGWSRYVGHQVYYSLSAATTSGS